MTGHNRSAMEQKIAAKLADGGEQLQYQEGRFHIVSQFGDVSSRSYTLAGLARKLGVYLPAEDHIDWYLNPLRMLTADPDFISHLAGLAPAGTPPLRWMSEMTLGELSALFVEWNETQSGE